MDDREKNMEILHWWDTQVFAPTMISLEDVADAMYDILVETCDASASPMERDAFIFAHARQERPATEFRFGGSLGFGGKFRNHRGWFVDCYPEDRTPERDAAILECNTRLKSLWESQSIPPWPASEKG